MAVTKSSLSAEEFLNELDRNSSLRLKYLNDLNTLAHNESLDVSCRFHQIRSNIPTLYSQYEGFVKNMFNLIPIYLNSLNKSSIKIKNKYFSLFLGLNIYYFRNLNNFLDFTQRINNCVDNFLNNNLNFFENYTQGSLVIQHDENFYELLSFLDFEESIVNKFQSLNFKIRQYYKRRNDIIHGSIDGNDSSFFYLRDTLNEQHLDKVLNEWNEEYECIKELIDLLRTGFYNWVQHSYYAERSVSS
ncbi:HEPN domain-containing protein [Clostridium sp. CX1]|uniref:MAE_28990/MAE_18760 family HEPN-like nuclease n=1 Tax=Clostridium sp. CX1 TaxID=2978346 RepID=UPI0021C04F09|nr:MAE_28990/MAE_18760 family HEPN-like nuclease [Clostridium sp. CX1]MCT8978694.1 HEPN domain-containing protein [Clostridium sp. CX1]